jgi:small GTP-binding protein
LARLDLSKNRISKLPREIVNLRPKIKWEWLPGKDGIFLADNPLESPPIEIVKRGTYSVRNYFKSIEIEEVSRVYEAKLLIVGEGGVGKTCLMKRLMIPDEEIDQNELTTEGIEINQWIIKTNKAKHFRVNIWDFGGQEIYHATHQFFLTKRSLYIFVWAARTDDDLTSFDYWLNVVRLLSGNSPVIVVLNKIDERLKSIDELSLQTKFDNVVCFDRASALKGTGIEDLASKIREQIDQLPHIGDILPTVWIDIRRRLEGLDKNYISFDEYKAVCSEFGLDEERAEFLSQYYHDLGIFLHFLDNSVLREIVFLKPDWATNAVYKVMDTKEIQENHGKFHFDQLRSIWFDYPQDKFAHLLELMKKFELCFQIPENRTYIVPELLRPSKPNFEWNYADNIRFEYRYDFMPAGIVTRFIVRTHDIVKKDIYWKNGVILERENTEALVVSERLNRKISICIRGEETKELLAIIRREIDYIHKTLNNPGVKEMIPCICRQCAMAEQPYFYDYRTLFRFRSKGKKRIACEKSTQDVRIEKLLGDYEQEEEIVEMERRERDAIIHKIEVSPHIEVSPTIEQKPVIEQHLVVDLSALAQELEDLRKKMRSKSDNSIESDVAAGEIAKAQKAAKEGDRLRSFEHLKAAGKWAFDFATSVGSSLVAEAIKKSMEM